MFRHLQGNQTQSSHLWLQNYTNSPPSRSRSPLLILPRQPNRCCKHTHITNNVAIQDGEHSYVKLKTIDISPFQTDFHHGEPQEKVAPFSVRALPLCKLRFMAEGRSRLATQSVFRDRGEIMIALPSPAVESPPLYCFHPCSCTRSSALRVVSAGYFLQLAAHVGRGVRWGRPSSQRKTSVFSSLLTTPLMNYSTPLQTTFVTSSSLVDPHTTSWPAVFLHLVSSVTLIPNVK